MIDFLVLPPCCPNSCVSGCGGCTGQLSYFVDTVEVAIMEEVRRRTRSFFDLAAEFSSLEEQMEDLRDFVAVFRWVPIRLPPQSLW